MSLEWYYLRGSQIHGPFTTAQLRENALAGILVPTDQVRRGGDGNWVSAAKVKGLFDPHLSPPPSLAPAPEPVREAPAGIADSDSNSRLISCPDCEKSVSKKANQCPHCGCPLASIEPKPQVVTQQQQAFDIVFRCVVQAVRDVGYAVQSMDKQNGMIAFKTGISWWSFGQDVQIVVVDEGDSTCSIDMTNSFQAITDWGEGKRIGEKIVKRTRELLQAEGLDRALR